jgi:hypothetical protein
VDKSKLFGLVSWAEFREEEYEDTPFLINPYICRAGITFLWGETSSGKSPVSWAMASAVGEGKNFFGLPVEAGKVLYIETDTPRRQVHERVRQLPAPANVDFLFLPPLSVPQVDAYSQDQLDKAAENNYDLVIINTLRKIHSMNDKEPLTPQIVYKYFQTTFPGAALVFVHHTKKTQWDQTGEKVGSHKESFSGAMNWLNDAQVGIQLVPWHSHGLTAKLNHYKSQVSAEYRGLGLSLADNGASLRCPPAERLEAAAQVLGNTPLRGVKLDQEIASHLGVSSSTAHRLRKHIEDGEFPGVAWLGLRHGTVEDETSSS